MFDELNSCFNQPTPFQPNHLICLGDFNLPKINWVNGSPTPTSNTNIEKRIITFTKTLQLKQHINFNTRGNNILDLIFSTPDAISNIQIFDENQTIFRGLDHVIIQFNINASPSLSNANIKYLNFHKADFHSLSFFLATINWSKEILKCKSSSDIFSFIKKQIYDGIYKYGFIPQQSTNNSDTTSKLPIFIQKQMKYFTDSLKSSTQSDNESWN
jgi:hypothetical protein